MSNYFAAVPEIKKVTEKGAVEMALANGLGIFQSALEAAYKELSLERQLAFADFGLGHLRDFGLWQLLEDDRKNIPNDAFIDLAYKPSYGLLALCMHLALTAPEEFFVADREKQLGKLLHAAWGRGLKDHGYEGEAGFWDNLAVLNRAGLADFITRYSVKYPQELGKYAEILNLQAKQKLAVRDGYTETVFVYGTLMRGQRANDLLKDARFGGCANLQGFACYDLGSFPGVVPQAGAVTYGEIYFVHPELVERMDQYESEGSLYLRQKVNVSSPHGNIAAWVYVYNNEPEGALVTERWQGDDWVWYACYGSNLAAERFSYYIKGGIYPINGRRYYGCCNKTSWRDSYWEEFKGRMYFAKKSESWQWQGVAFYDVAGEGITEMRLYLVTREQLRDIKFQECSKEPSLYPDRDDCPGWYANQVYLGRGYDGREVYTVTSYGLEQKNLPCEDYQRVIKNALVQEKGVSSEWAEEYLKRCKA